MGRGQKKVKGQQPLFANMPKQLASLPPAPSKGEKLSPEVEEKIKEWHIIYPIYINNRKKLVDGRRIAKEKGCMNPTCQEIQKVCQYLGLQAVIESGKCYPRDPHGERGRVRVQLRQKSTDEGAEAIPVNAEVPNRKALMLKLGELIPKLSTRASQGEGSGSSASGTNSASGGGGQKTNNNNNKKKNKGRRR